MLLRRRGVSIDTDRLTLKLPVHANYKDWSLLRSQNQDFLKPWDPAWSDDHLTRKSFTNRVYWSQKAVQSGTAVPLFVFEKSSNRLIGALTLDNIRRGPAQTATLGYWLGEPYTKSGFMREAVEAIVQYGFQKLDLSRVEAACLPENSASRKLLESSEFKYEGVAQAYLQINGRWRTHVLYGRLRYDRRGKSDTGQV